MRILCLAKARYTNRDVIEERFGRVDRLPRHWRAAGHDARLELIDYRSLRRRRVREPELPIRSHPFADPSTAFRLRRLAARWRPRVVVASGDCLLGLLGLRLARAAGARFVFDVYDDYRTFGGYRLFLGRDVFGRLLERADLVFYASQAMAAAHPGPGPGLLVPNAVDTEQFTPMPAAQAREQLGMPAGVSYVGYFGSMELDRGVGDLIAAVEALRRRRGDVRLLVCGTRHPATPLERPWIDYRGAVPHARVPLHISACDAVALPYRRSEMMDRGASCKIAEYLACRRPVVATRTPNLLANFPLQAEALEPALAKPGDPEDLARAIEVQLDRAIVLPVPPELTWARVAADAERALSGIAGADPPPPAA